MLCAGSAEHPHHPPRAEEEQLHAHPHQRLRLVRRHGSALGPTPDLLNLALNYHQCWL